MASRNAKICGMLQYLLKFSVLQVICILVSALGRKLHLVQPLATKIMFVHRIAKNIPNLKKHD
jgi:hypothetical protein